MIKRGKILRDTSMGPGLLSVDGNQHPFTLEGMWLSDVPPKIGMTTDVTFEGDRVESVKAVPENQIAKEQAEQALRHGGDFANRIKAKFGLPMIVAFAVLIIGWLFLSSIDIGREAFSLQVTFWQLLHVVGTGNGFQNLAAAMVGSGSAGIYGLLAIASLAGPFLAFLWQDRRALLGGLLPLLMMLLVGGLILHDLHKAGDAVGSMLGAGPAAQKMIDDARAEIMSQFQLGAGIWVSLAAAIYFAFNAVKKYLVAGA